MNPLVLVVDDKTDEVDGFLEGLKRVGIATLCAKSAAEGIELARATLPAIVVSALDLPGMSGIGLLEELKNSAETRWTCVILTHTDWRSERGHFNSWSQPTKSGWTADMHWMKPYEPEWVTWIQNILRMLRVPSG